MPVRTCAHCSKPLDPNQSAKAKYCSASCRVLACRERRKHGTPPKRKPEPKPEPAPQLNSRDFDRMMDGDIEDDLRHARDRLKQYLDDPATPANAISNIVARYVAVCEKLHDMAGGDDLLADLTDDTSEVNADAGTSIV